MYDFNEKDLKDVERYTRGKLVLNFLSHFFLELVVIFASAIIANQYIAGRWQQLIITVAISIYPSIKIYKDMQVKRLEINQVYTYMVKNKDEIIKAINDLQKNQEDRDE